MVSLLTQTFSNENVLVSLIHEIFHGGSFESPSASGHGQSSLPLETLDLAPIISRWRKMDVRTYISRDLDNVPTSSHHTLF
jgi:hypothetical protein